MIGTWTPPGAIFTVAFDDEKLTCELVKRTEIPKDEPISWMTFDVSPLAVLDASKLSDLRASLRLTRIPACQEEHIRCGYEEVVQLLSKEPYRDSP
jgi:hypothetical protein